MEYSELSSSITTYRLILLFLLHLIVALNSSSFKNMIQTQVDGMVSLKQSHVFNVNKLLANLRVGWLEK